MTRVLLVGYDPETVDFSNPALLPGMTIEKIRAGVALALKQMMDRGWEGDVCYIRPDGMAGQMVERHLASANYACVVIGAVSACLLRALQSLRLLLTRSIKPPQRPSSHLIRDPKTALMRPRDGYLPAESRRGLPLLLLESAKKDYVGEWGIVH
jgi:hypothetical protein